jgi:hypothetical protein
MTSEPKLSKRALSKVRAWSSEGTVKPEVQLIPSPRNYGAMTT